MVTLPQALRLIGDYARERLAAQIQAVAPIVLYLVLFQIWVLGIPIRDAALVALGLALVVGGLTLFMEGLLLGLMPLGEHIGLRLPQRAGLTLILPFAFLLGVGATFAEPAIGVLRAAGAAIRPWEAPLLFLLLNDYADALVWSVGLGVGAAVVGGMLRFLFQWSLKPFIYGLVGSCAALTLWAWFDPNLRYLTGLAWDSGAVTTGPVTVPLVLALGIGVSRVVTSGEGESQGFGVVTLASLFPILAVLLLGVSLTGRAPAPSSEAELFAPNGRTAALTLFGGDEQRLIGYALRHGSEAGRDALFAGDGEALRRQVAHYATDADTRQRAFGDDANFAHWLATAPPTLQEAAAGFVATAPTAGSGGELSGRLLPNLLLAVQAILPLSLFLLLVLKALRFRLRHGDEVALGIGLALAGMTLFNIGIELGLARLGNQLGERLPAAYTAIWQPELSQVVEPFDPALVQQALAADGQPAPFFFIQQGQTVQPVPFAAERFDAASGRYTHIPSFGPLFSNGPGIALVLAFAFVMGYAATLAEPALNALGLTVERVTGGSFRKALLVQAVAIGVGLGLTVGVVKIVWDLPLAWLIVPPYLLLLPLTYIAPDEFTDIAWDAAGVTTGPITVPLVLALGLGIGAQAGGVEGFGLLAMASVCPIISVLAVGLYVTARHRRELELAEENELEDRPA